MQALLAFCFFIIVNRVLTVKTVAATPEPQVKVELEMPQLPLEDLSVNPDPITFLISMV